MEIYLLLGEKSSKLKDIDLFCHVFEKNNVKIRRILTDDIDISTDGVYINGRLSPLPDCVISAYYGNMISHNLYITQMFESIGILCIDSYDCLIDAKDKLKTIFKIKKHMPEINIPKTLFYSPNITEEMLSSIGYPLVVKINSGSKGKGVALCNSFEEAIKKAKEFSLTFNDDIIFQEYISSSKGIDLRFILCGGKYITSFTRSNSNSFISNVAQGGKITHFDADEFLIRQTEKLASILDINLGSIDYLFGENGKYYFCESNGMPGLKYTKAYVEMGRENPLDKIFENIMLQINEHKKKADI